MKGFNFGIKINGFDGFSDTFANLSHKIDRIGKKIQKFGKSMKSFGDGMTKYVSLPLASVGLYSIKSAADIEQMTIALEGMAGGAKAASDLMKQLLDFSASTPFQIDGIADSARMLLATGKVGVQDIQDALKVTGDIAAGSKSNINEISYIMAKAASKGKVDQELLNMFLERGINIRSELAKVTGKDGEALQKLISKGKISAEILFSAMRNMTEEGGIFFNAMKKQSLSVKGLWSTLVDNINVAAGALGDAIIQSTDFKTKITDLTDSVKEFAGWFSGLPAPVKETAVNVGLIAVALGPVISGVGQLIIGIGLIAALLPNIIAGLKFLMIATPWLVVLSSVAYIFIKLSQISEMVGGLGNLFKIAGSYFVDALLIPFRGWAMMIEKIWGLFGNPPKGLSDFANADWFGSSRDMAKGMMIENIKSRENAAGRASIINDSTKSLVAGIGRTALSQKTEVEVSFKNPPQGMRTTVKGGADNVTVEQGMSMAGAY